MSADSPNHSRPELTATMQNVVTPQPVTDTTILDSVAGFINEVVPTACSDTFDSKDQIQWVRFENLNSDEGGFAVNNDTSLPSSLILVLGYTTGIQVWAVPANGEAVELFSWRHGSVKVLRILPAPYEVGSKKRDQFDSKRPLMALVDVGMHGSSSAFSLNFYSLKSGEQVKQIKFKTPILDVVANRRSVVATFSEKLAVFDAFTLEDKLSVTTCYLSPGVQANPVALGPRWLAFAEKKLIASRRSSGGNEGEGVQSYTATVLHAAKSLGRGLRELGDAVASSLTGNQTGKLGTSPNSPQAGGSGDVPQKGIVTILDLESSATQNADGSLHAESIVAHFVAHTEAIVWLQFGPCGLLLLTADKRGHDFNLFRINPHPVGSALAAVHHLYTLHRGDTSSRVQDMCFSFDSRWAAVSTLRGTTHVFPITPYGGNVGVRTHTTPHVVNRMSRFHRSAGLTSEGRSNSPVSMFDSPVSSTFPYHNPRFAPFPHPTVVTALAQLRQPVYMQNIGSSTPRQGRQRVTSSSEENIALRLNATFAPARAWIDSTTSFPRDTSLNKTVKPVESLFIMNCHGILVQYDLEPHHATHIPKEKVCDDSPVELTVVAKAQWRLQRQPASIDRPLPLPHQGLMFLLSGIPAAKKKVDNGNDDDWLSQVEITTHAGPHRRLWMGPQFTFKTYTTTNGTPMSLADAQPLDLNRSKPVNMPITKANAVLIESSSASSSEQCLLDMYRKNSEEFGVVGEHQIKEDLADAMMESPGLKEGGGRCVLVSMKSSPNPPRRATAAPSPIAKVVNPLGTVVTVYSDEDEEIPPHEDIVIYENCDETLFRPLVTPKSVSYVRSSKADGNIMMQSLKGDTNVTVRVLDKSEGMVKGTNWEDPRVQDLRNDTKVIVQQGEVRDLLQSQKSVVTQSDEEKVSGKVSKGKFPEKNEENYTKKPNPSEYRNSSERETSTKKVTSKTKNKEKKIKAVDPVIQPEFDKKATKPVEAVIQPQFDDSSFGLVNPLYNVLEECERIKSKKISPKSLNESEKPQHDVPDSYAFPKISARKFKTKKISVDEIIKIDTASVPEPPTADILPEYSEEVRKELDNEVSFTLPTVKAAKIEPSAKATILNHLESVEELSFPALDSKLLTNTSDFPPLEENFFSLENLVKPEKYEDAEDCGLPIEPMEKYFTKETPHINPTDESIMEELDKKKASLKKPRKVKTKLGVKISKEESPDRKEPTPERSLADAEITLPVPKRSWSSIAATPKPAEPSKIDPWVAESNNNSDSFVENFTVTLPSKKTFSVVTTEKLLDIDTPEEPCDMSPSCHLLDKSPDFLKLSDRSSDDEKVESGSSPVETTESSDEGKISGITGDDDIKNISVSVVSKSSAKRRIKKKKK
ncbi:breast carcinoma-amplified sequence 3 homolog [Euwallacea similis]|uniref:breast carcinoma-amplified sequence 3 homolog n=1 Tax=Euwallacea similis TaxID=1736056 RepID=UPI003450028F